MALESITDGFLSAFISDYSLDSAMFTKTIDNTSPKRQRVNESQSVHSLTLFEVAHLPPSQSETCQPVETISRNALASGFRL
jgi:hypothetical protein